MWWGRGAHGGEGSKTRLQAPKRTIFLASRAMPKSAMKRKKKEFVPVVPNDRGRHSTTRRAPPEEYHLTPQF